MIKKEFEILKKEIDALILKYLPKRVSKKWLKEVFGEPRYKFSEKAVNEAILKPIWEFLSRGGKRWRPILFLLATETLGGDIKKVKDFAIIPELIHNGCLSKDAFVLKNPGEQVRITEIKEGDYVYTLNAEGKLAKNKVMGIKFSGIKKVYKLITRNREIEATENHPFLVIKKEQPKRYLLTKFGREKIHKRLKRGDIKKLSGLLKRKLRVLYNALSLNYYGQLLEKNEVEFIFKWLKLKLENSDYSIKQTKFESPVIKLFWKKLKEIKPGDKIIILNKIPDNGKPLELPQPPKNPNKDKTKIPEVTNKEFCQLVGYILGDGSISIDKKSSRVCLCPSNDEEEISAYSSLFSKVFSYELKRYRGKQGNYLTCCSFKVCWLLDRLGLNKKATKKIVPDWIFTLPENQKLAFVRGYLDSDGWVGKDGTTYFSSSNKNLIEKLKLLLDSLGFTTSHIFYKKNKNLWKISKKKFSNQWSISLGNPHLVLEKIGTEKNYYRKRLEKDRKGKNFRFLGEFPRLPIDFPNFRVDRVKTIEFEGEKPVYDLMIENSHNFIANNVVVHNSIIVDDIEDQGELRRGKPCLHRIFGEDIALNVGNFLYFFPFFILKKNEKRIPPQVLLKAYKVCLKEMLNLHLGQGTDIFWHKGKAKKISQKEYLQMCAFKTGSMARLSAKLAVILTKGDEKLAEKFGKFAEALGIAFQIQDDILDLTLEGKEREKFGKTFGNDIKEGKRSLPIIFALNRANQKDKKRLIEILNKHTENSEEIKEAILIIEKYKGIILAKKIAQKIVRKAWGEIEKFLPESKAKKAIRDLTQFLIQRKI